MSTYVINGPTTIGDTGSLNTIQGDVTLPDIGVLEGELYYAGATGNLVALPLGTTGQILTSNGTIPAWGSNTSSTDGFSVGKTASTFTNAQLVIGTWSTTAPPGTSINPFFNTGTQLALSTGIFTPDTTGVYQICAFISYINTSNSGNKTLIFAEQTTGPVYNTIITTGAYQPTGAVATGQIISINQAVMLEATKTYVLTIQSSTATGTNTIQAGSRFSAVLISM